MPLRTPRLGSAQARYGVIAMRDLGISFDNSYARQLNGFYVSLLGDKAPAPEFLKLNKDLALEIGMDISALETESGAAFLSGGVAVQGAAPLAMAYAGHQFGGFSPQLGDGRALLLGEVIDTLGNRRDIHLKGSGKTPFSRGGDGKALIGPVLREYLIGEAMHALGVPTTRALAAVKTGEVVQRETPQPGAVLARVAASHLRVGTFQFFAARGDTQKLFQLADYAIARHDPDLIDQPDRHIRFLERVTDRQAHLIAQWVSLGFVHGVMNTDNMTISGETIDYGPCAFVDMYDPKAVFSSIDRNGRYALENQAAIGAWNLARLAEALLDLINPMDSDDAIRQATNVVESFTSRFDTYFTDIMRGKLGLKRAEAGDAVLIADLLTAMTGQAVDYTSAMRALSEVSSGPPERLRGLFTDPSGKLEDWLARYDSRLASEAGDVAARVKAANPIFIPRNHLVEEALEAAEKGDMAPFDTLLDRVTHPFEPAANSQRFAEPAPDSYGAFVSYCGT